MAILQDLLMPSFVRDVISRVRVPGRYLSRYFGFGIDGANTVPVATAGQRQYTYDIFDNVRTIPNGRLPGAPSGTIAPNPVGNNTVTLARFAEKLPLDYNQLAAIRTLGKSAGDRDRMGASYIDRQVAYLRQRSENLWEFLTGALFRGGVYYFYQNGDDLVPTYESSSTFFGVDLKIPSSNKGNIGGGSFSACLQMGTGSNIIDTVWSNTSAEIVTDLNAIDSAFQDLVGAPLETVLCGSDVWTNVLANTQVRNMAGSASEPFAAYNLEDVAGPDGTPTGVRVGSIKALPWLKWVIWDGSLSIATSSATTFGDVKLLPRNHATFMVGDTTTWLKGIIGSEIVKDNDLAPPQERFGFYTWAMEKADPAAVWYHTLQNVGIELNMPKGIATARVL